MSAPNLTALIARCRTLCRPRSTAADAELVRGFARQRDVAAFEELLERYAPLVWGVCRRILQNEADCEDAFQATFLALVRKPSAIDPRQALGAWLHTVAVRVARKALFRSQRQRPQSLVGQIPNPSHRSTAGDVAEEVGSRELSRLVDEEIERLPDTLREPLVLCCLHGRTRDEAAEALGCSLMVVKGRLERGRDLLRRRLQRRGVELPAAFLVLGLTCERIRAALWAKTIQAVLYTPAPAVAALAEAGVSAAMIGKNKLLIAAFLLVMSATGAVGAVLSLKPAETPASPQSKSVMADKGVEVPQVRTDRHGDPLPDGAIARLGTVRWRHGFFVRALAYSPNGKMIAAVGAGRAITLWDAATGKEVRQFPNLGLPSAIAFSPDGKILATSDNSTCHLWDVATAKELRQLKDPTKRVCGLAFAPDGRTLATVDKDATARIWDATDGKEVCRIDCKQGDLNAVAYSPDGKFLATAGRDGTIRLWDRATRKLHRQLNGHQKEVWKLVFSPDDTRLASSAGDGTVRLWEVATARQIRIFGEKLDRNNLPLAFSPDGNSLAAGVGDGFLRLWDVDNGVQKRQWQAGAMDVGAIAFSPDGKTLASAAPWEGIRLWDAATGRERHPSEEHLGVVELVRFSADGTRLFSISRERRMLCWDVAKQLPRRQFTWGDRGAGVSETALSPDGNTLAEGCWSDEEPHKLNLWDLRTGKLCRQLGEPQRRFWSLAFSPDGLLVASTGSDQAVHIWNARDGVEVHRITVNRNNGARLDFSPDGKTLIYSPGISAPGQPAPQLWDVSTGKERRISLNKASSIRPIAFSPDGKMLAAVCSASEERTFVCLFDVTSGKELCCHEGHQAAIAAFSPDGKLVVSGGRDGKDGNSIHIWEAATGRLVRRFAGHHSCVASAAFAPDGVTVASGGGDSTILLWDITGRRADSHWHVKPLTAREAEACWTALAKEDAAKAYDAVWKLVAAPEQAVPFLRKKLSPVSHPDARAVARLIEDLDSDDFLVRQKAAEELAKLGDFITSSMRRTLDNKPSLEVRRRVEELLEQSRGWTLERLRAHRAIQALEHIGTSSARELLQTLATGAPEARQTEEAKAALQRLARSSSPVKKP